MFEIIVIILCVTVNALLAGVEMGFVSSSKSRLRQMAKKGNQSAKQILEYRENPERTLSVIQIGITLVGAFAAAVGGAGATESITPYLQAQFGLSEAIAESISLTMVVIPITYFSVVFGELIPKTLALRNPVWVSLKSATWLSIADRILTPVVNVLEWSTKKIIITFFKKAQEITPASDSIIEIDNLEHHHQQAVLNLAHLERRHLKDIFVPWEDVTSLRPDNSIEEIVTIIFASGHTRLPVKDADKVIGLLHTKEFLGYRENKGEDWNSIIRPMLKVLEKDNALTTLRLMQKNRIHMADVRDNSGVSLGIITLEDILEEFLGEIFDEDDESMIRKIFVNRAKRKIKPS